MAVTTTSGAAIMRDGPQDCRRFANRYRATALVSRSLESKRSMNLLAAEWDEIANELQRGQLLSDILRILAHRRSARWS